MKNFNEILQESLKEDKKKEKKKEKDTVDINYQYEPPSYVDRSIQYDPDSNPEKVGFEDKLLVQLQYLLLNGDKEGANALMKKFETSNQFNFTWRYLSQIDEWIKTIQKYNSFKNPVASDLKKMSGVEKLEKEPVSKEKADKFIQSAIKFFEKELKVK